MVKVDTVYEDEFKRWWLPNLQMWYVSFYRKNGNKVRGVLGSIL